MRPSVLLISDTAVALGPELERASISTMLAPATGLRDLPAAPGAILVDPERMGWDVAESVESLAEVLPGVPVVVMGESRLASAVAALRAGAADYLERASTSAEVVPALTRLLEQRLITERLSSRVPPSAQFPELLGESSAIAALRSRIAQAAASDVTTLVVGETGTGKELVARLVHAASVRAQGPLVVVNCAAIPDSLADSELFGHVKGAFSGASAHHQGLFRAAHEGTLFLDDVGALSWDVQAKLLRALQQRSVRPLGGGGELPVDFRVIASTTVELEALVRAGRFRQDLYYRLAVLEVHVPPLRERDLDAMLLAERFLEEAGTRSGRRVKGITPAVARVFLSYPWPGNVRELKNCVDYAVAVARYDHVTESDLPEALRERPSQSPQSEGGDRRWETIERRHIEAVLRSVHGNQAHAARLLGIDRKTLHRKLEKMNIDVPVRTRSGVRIASPAASAKDTEPAVGDENHPTRYRFIFR